MMFVLPTGRTHGRERDARRVGRIAGVGGAAIGTGAVVHAVGVLGAAGYGASGISSGRPRWAPSPAVEW